MGISIVNKQDVLQILKLRKEVGITIKRKETSSQLDKWLSSISAHWLWLMSLLITLYQQK